MKQLQIPQLKSPSEKRQYILKTWIEHGNTHQFEDLNAMKNLLNGLLSALPLDHDQLSIIMVNLSHGFLHKNLTNSKRWPLIPLVLEHGGDLNMPDLYENTILHYAALSDAKSVQFCLDHGSHINVFNKDGKLPIHTCIETRPDDCADIIELLKKDSLLDFPPLQPEIHGHILFCPPLLLAIRQHQLSTVKQLLDAGAPLSYPKTRDDPTRSEHAIIMAASIMHTEITEELLKRGANIHDKDDQGYTPLHTAAMGHDLNYVKFLLDHGANPLEMNPLGHTPRDIAYKFHNDELFLFLNRIQLTINERTAIELALDSAASTSSNPKPGTSEVAERKTSLKMAL